MEQLLAKHVEHVIGTRSGFDRSVLHGTLRMLAHRGGLMTYLSHARVLLTAMQRTLRRFWRFVQTSVFSVSLW